MAVELGIFGFSARINWLFENKHPKVQFQQKNPDQNLEFKHNKSITSPNPAWIAITNCRKKLITQYTMWPPPCVAVSPWSWKLRLKRCDLHIQAFQPFKRCHLCCQPAFNSSIILRTCFGAWNAAELYSIQSPISLHLPFASSNLQHQPK